MPEVTQMEAKYKIQKVWI